MAPGSSPSTALLSFHQTPVRLHSTTSEAVQIWSVRSNMIREVLGNKVSQQLRWFPESRKSLQNPVVLRCASSANAASLLLPWVTPALILGFDQG
eukprot:3204300-Rhodomonas_salina.1